MKCKNCNHKIVLAGRDRFGAYVYRHIWENELGYCQAKNCGCNNPERKQGGAV